MGNWEPAAHTERERIGNPPPKTARTKVLLYSHLQKSRAGDKQFRRRKTDEDNEVVAALVVGYPKHRFVRAIRRKISNVRWVE